MKHAPPCFISVTWGIVALLIGCTIILLMSRHGPVAFITCTFAAILVVIALIPVEYQVTTPHTYTHHRGTRLVVDSKTDVAHHGEPVAHAALAHTQMPPTPHADDPVPTPLPHSAAHVPVFHNMVASEKVIPATSMRNYIRSHGIHGVVGNSSCRKLQRGAVADKGFVIPQVARAEMLNFLAHDTVHAKDTHLIPKTTAHNKR